MGQFLRTKPTQIIMLRFVVLAVAVAAEADPQVAYANGLGYGHAYAGFAGYPTAYGGYAAPAYAGYAAAAPVAAVAAPVAAPAVTYGTPVAHGLGLPEAATYVAPPVRTVAEAPIVEQVVEPVEQWGYKVAY